MQIEVYTDGGSRGNPGAAAIGVLVIHDDDQIYTHAARIGVATNNEAEYEAFIHSVEWIVQFSAKNPIASVVWKLDSKLVVEQLLKRWKIKEPRMRIFAEKAWRNLESLNMPYTITHIPRAQNAQADALVNAALDAE